MASKPDKDQNPADGPGAEVPHEDGQREDGEIEDSDGELDPSLPIIKATTNDRFSAIPATSGPALPYDDEPALPDEAPPQSYDDGWDAYQNADSTYYFYNRFTGAYSMDNPRQHSSASSYGPYDRFVNSSATIPTANVDAASAPPEPKRRVAGGYNPAIHGSYDPNADYAKEAEREAEEEEARAAAAAAAATNAFAAPYMYGRPAGEDYATTAHFNRFTGQFQRDGVNPEYHNDEHKSNRQMASYFDVDAAANSHDGRSLKAERRNKHLSRKELQAFKERRKEKQYQKKVAWLKKD